MCVTKYNPTTPSNLLFQTGMILLLMLCFGNTLLRGQTHIDAGTFLSDGAGHQVEPVAGEQLYYDFTVPQAGVMPYLNLTARGADGGKAWIKNILGNTVRTARGGQGATVKGTFKIGTGTGELRPNSTIRLIVGMSGSSRSNCSGCIGVHGGGGGGGTGILYLPAGADATIPSNWIILAVAGGGGGGCAGTSTLADDGYPGQTTEHGYVHAGFKTGADWHASFDGIDLSTIFSHNRNGGFYAFTAGGGGGTSHLNWSQTTNGLAWSSDIKYGYPPNIMGDGYTNPDNFLPVKIKTLKYEGKGLFQMVDGKMLPIGGMGGIGDCNGGYGCGGGGASEKYNNQDGVGGGGGGYSGGNPGIVYEHKTFPDESTLDFGGGGGGSYLNPDFVHPASGTITKNGVTDNPANGFVQYQFTAASPVTRDLGFHYNKSTEASVLKTGDWDLRWQYDGNLVLYQAGVGAKWASNTNTKGTDIYFQGDGNLVIRQSGNAVFATNTANDQHGGKGGRKLVLTPEGGLYITDQDGKVIWRGR